MIKHRSARPYGLKPLAAISLAALVAIGCSDDDNGVVVSGSEDADSAVGGGTNTDGDIDTDAVTDNDNDTDTTAGASNTVGAIDVTRFVDGALSEDPTIVDCTLSDGTESSCYQIVTVGTPAGSTVGPFCPETIDDTADTVGIWQDGSGIVYDVDGDFIVNVPNIYDDPEWQLYDPDTREVFFINTLEGCEGAAQPEVEEQYQNHCVQCSLDYVDGGVSATYLIPVTPSLAADTGVVRNVGVALNGTQLAGPAPVDAILSNYTIAAFDDCGGHINPNDGYHYHAATGCSEENDTQSDGHASLLGYAMDGYGIYGLLDADGNESTDLDECRGHTDDTRGYHYHTAAAGENMFIGCFSGNTASADNGGGPGDGPPDGEGPPEGLAPLENSAD